jgi:hyaluronate lyase
MISPIPRVYRRVVVTLLVAGGALLAAACSLIVDTSHLTGGAADDAASQESGSTPDGSGTQDQLVDSSGDAASDATLGDGASPDTGGRDATDSSTDRAATTDTGGPDVGPLLTTTDLLPTKDSYVRDGSNANTNYGSASNLDIKVWSSAGLTRNTWLSFDVRAYPRIVSAKLRLFVNYVGVEDAGGSTGVYYAPTASDSWSETQLTWNTVPAPGNTPDASIATGSIDATNLNNWIEFDVTSSVAADTDGTVTLVVSPWTSVQTKLFGFVSREGANSPVLRIVH